MGYYVIRQDEEFLIESPMQILRVSCDGDGKIRMQRNDKTKNVKIRKVYTEVNQNAKSK